MPPAVRYPQGPVTPHGAWHITHDRIPQVSYTSPDETIVFNMMGGLSIPDRTMPEAVEITDIEGLIPPWTDIEQKGATEDGASYISTLYDPMETDITVRIGGRDPAYTRQVIRDWIAAWDAKRPGELGWFTHAMGYWWAPMQWAKKPTDKLAALATLRQPFKWSVKCYDAFWRTYDDAFLFKLDYGTYTSDADFTHDTVSELGPNWDCTYSGSGGGWIQISNYLANWVDDPAHPIGSDGRTVVCRPKNFTATTDNVVAELTLGWFDEWSYPDNAFDDIWVRIPTPGTTLPAIPDGVRLHVGIGEVRLSCFVGGVEVWYRDQFLFIPPVPTDKFTLIAGYDGNPNQYTVQRNGVTIMSVVMPPSPMGSGQRGGAFGMHAGAAILTQATPAAVQRFTVGDHGPSGAAINTQTGFVSRTNVGDQTMFDRYTCFGPGMFYFNDGPNSTAQVAFGPLLDGQIAQLRTDPRKRGVTDLTPGGAASITQPQSNVITAMLADFISYATANNVSPLLQAIESAFGVVPPQGNLYALLKGRWSDAAGIPPKPAGLPATPYHVGVTIEGGNADSAILVAGTPLRRWPQ